MGDWSVEPTLDRISRGSEAVNLRPQVMELLVYLAERSGEVVSTNEVLNDLWPGKVVTSGSVYNCIAELRHALGAGDERQVYIETIPKRGYRLVAPVTGVQQSRRASEQAEAGTTSLRRTATVQFVAVLAIVLVAGFLLSRTVLDQPPPAPPPDSDLSIAVLPFEDLSPEGNQAYLSDGIAEELLNALAQTRELRVISRTSSFALRDGAALSTPELAKKLNVTHVLEGALRRAGNRIRISAQLIDARTDTHLWSQTYDRTLGDIFAIQREISRQVVDALKIQLFDQTVKTSVTDPEVLELYLKGRYQLSKRFSENLQQAAGLFEQAIGIDPEYAPAHAGLAKALLLQEDLRSGGATAMRRRGVAALERALQLDPDNSDALATRGLMLSASDREAARDDLERAIAQNSSNSDAYRWLALYYGQSDPTRYLEFMRRAYLVDPLVPSLNFHRAVALYHVGRYDEALVAARDWYELNPAFAGPYGLAGMIHLAAGRPDQAIKSYYAAYRLQPDWGAPSTAFAWLLLRLNELELAQIWLRQSQKSSDEAAQALVLENVLCALRGEQTQARRRLVDIDAHHPQWWAELGRAFVLLGDFEHGRQAWERGLVDPLRDIPTNWEAQRLVDYSLALQRTGAADRAAELMTAALALIETQTGAGMVRYGVWNGVQESLQFQAAALHAMRDDTQPALEALQRNAQQESVFCTACLRQWPHFDGLRGDPDWAVLLDEQERRNAATSQRLADQDLLLTPEEVLQLDDFTYDPFVD